MILFIKRVFKFAWQDILRKKGLTTQAVFIMSVVIFFISAIFFTRGIGFAVIAALEEKVDIAVYFKETASQSDILLQQEKILEMPYTASAIFVSKEDALFYFLQKHKADSLYTEALSEVEENPFLNGLNIKAKNPVDYPQIVANLEQSPFMGQIERITYNENKLVIERLHSLTNGLQKTAIIITAVLCLLVVLILFNTSRLVIISQKNEIIASRLAGASNWFIRGPFLAQTVFYGLISVVLVDIVIFVLSLLLNDKMSNWFLNFYLLDYLKENIFWLLLIQVAASLSLGLVASALAVRKYLKI